jgi:hypothetical protein
VVVLLGRKTSSATSLAQVYISTGSPWWLSSIPPRTQQALPLFLHLYRYISLCPTLLLLPTCFPVIRASDYHHNDKPQIAKRGLFHVPFTSLLTFSSCGCSLPFRLLEVIPCFRRFLCTLYLPASIACLEGYQCSTFERRLSLI